jgi:hypothetical protein
MKNREAKPFSQEQVEAWLKSGHKPEDVKSLLQEITKAVLERALQGELAEHWAMPKASCRTSQRGTRAMAAPARA